MNVLLRASLIVMLACACACSDRASSAGGSEDRDAGSNDAGSNQDAGDDGSETLTSLDVGIISKSPASTREAESHVVASPDGRVIAAWIGRGGLSSHIGFAISMDDGASWNAPVAIPPPNGQKSADPALVADHSGNVYLAWLEFDISATGMTVGTHIYVSKSPAGSDSFLPPVEVTDPGDSAITDKPWITLTADGRVLVTYMRQTLTQGKTASLVAARSDDGTSFTRALVVGEGTAVNHAATPCAGSSGSRVWVAHIWYQGSITLARHVQLRWSDDGGLSWLPENVTDVSPASETDVGFDDPRCVAEGNDVWISYGLSHDTPSTETFGKLYALRLAHSSDGGKSIGQRFSIDDPASGAKYFLHPQLVRTNSGALHLAFYAGADEADEHASIRFMTSLDGGQSFAPSRVLREPVVFLSSRTTPRWIGEYFGFSSRGSTLYAAYVDNTELAAHVGVWRAARD